MIKKSSLAILLLIGLFVASCGGTLQTDSDKTIFDVQGENGFVGTVDGTDAFIALLVGVDEAIVYVCNGDEEIYEWFRGAISDPTDFSLTNGTGANITAHFVENGINGDVTLSNGNTYSFTAAPNVGENTGIHQVYGDQAAQDNIKAGWIVNSVGEERGALRVGTAFQKAPSIKEVSDGTSNTISLSAKTFPVRRFIIAPNNYIGTDGADVAN